MQFREPQRLWLVILFVAFALGIVGLDLAKHATRDGWATVTSIGMAIWFLQASYEQFRWAKIGYFTPPNKFATGFKLLLVSVVVLGVAMRFIA